MGSKMIEKMIVYRDKNGVVINIGEWDYMISYDDDNNEIVNNPLPEGATSKTENVRINEDGSREVA